MIYISVALYCEAKPIINFFNLKKNTNFTKFQVFQNEAVTLIITKTGFFNSIAALTHLFTKLPPSFSDVFLNIGICASSDKTVPIGSLFLCNKISDSVTNKTFYPDILFSNEFLENSITSFPVPQTSNDISLNGLIDMEAAPIYNTCLLFMNTHNIFFFKIVSDYMSPNSISSEEISDLINKKLPLVFNFLKKAASTLLKFSKSYFTKEEASLMTLFSESLCLTASMNNKFKQVMLYKKLKNKNISEILTASIHNIKTLNLNNKNERKKYFESFIREII